MSIIISNKFIHLKQLIIPTPWQQLNHMLKIRIPIYSLYCPPNLLFFIYFIIEPVQYYIFVLLLLHERIIVHTSPNNVPYFWMQSHHQKPLPCQLILIFNIEPSHQGMKPPLVLMIILKQHTHSVSTYFSKALYPPPPLGQSLSLPLNINPTYLLISH